MRRMLVVLGIISMILMMLPAAFAQSTATLTGTVRDATGAVIPGASVSVVNSTSGNQRKTVTGKEGAFTAPLLPVGTYTVHITAKGFAKYEATGIVLNAGDNKTITVELPLETVSAKVEVNTTLSEIVTVDSGEKSTMISNKELQDLSMVSRNATEFIKILSGATMTANGGTNRAAYVGETVGINGSSLAGNTGGLSAVQINGQSVDITQDGGHTFDPGASGSATPVNPNTDMISEVKVMTSNFSAENTKGPVVVNVVSKFGGKDFHGEAYLYARNYVLNANDYFVKKNGGQRGQSKYYYPGGNIGGPVLIPGTGFNKNRDKLFFFDGFESYRQTIDGGLVRAVVPTAAQLGGDFSPESNGQTLIPGHPAVGTNPAVAGQWVGGPGWNPNNGGSAIGNLHNYPTTLSNNNALLGAPASTPGAIRPGCVIGTGTWDPAVQAWRNAGILNAACIDQNGLKLMKAYLPAPNADPAQHNGYNFVSGIITPQNSWQNLARMDWNISDSTKVFARYSVQRETQNQPLGLWANTGSDNQVPSPTNIIGANGSDSWSTSLTHVFSPTMTSETTFAYTYINFPNAPTDPTKILRQPMGLTITGIYANPQAPSFTTWGGSVPNLGSGSNLGADYHPTMICFKGIPSIAENFVKVFGTHTTKVGFYLEHTYNKQDNWGQYGVFQMAQGWGNTSGNNYTDMLMGLSSGGYTEQQLPPPTEIAQTQYSFYATDSWKATRRMTIEFGMRFEHWGKPYAANNYGLAIFDASKYNDALAQRDNNTGISWYGLDHSIPKSGAQGRALFYSPRFGLTYDVFGNSKTVIRGGYGLYRAYDSLQSNSYTGPAGTALGAATFSCSTYSGVGTCDTFEQIDLSKTDHQLGGRLGPGLKSVTVTNPNNNQQPLVTTYSLNIDQRLPANFNLELSYVGNHTDNLQQQIDVNSAPIGAGFSPSLPLHEGQTNFNSDSLRPRQNYQAITEAVTAGIAQYDSFQASLRRNVGFLTLQANYTYGRTMADNAFSGAYADLGRHEYWGVSPQNRAQVLSLAYVINVPNMKGGGKLVHGFTNGWQISGITQIESGANLTSQNLQLNYGMDNTTHTIPDPADSTKTITITDRYNDNVGVLGTAQATLYPTIVCNPLMNKNIPGVGTQFLNPACFAPANSAGGTTRMPYLEGPKFWNSDITLMKNFQITERQKVQFRIQAFNFLNHPLTSYSPGDSALKIHFNGDGTMQNANTFGIAQYKYGHRIVEFAVKYMF